MLGSSRPSVDTSACRRRERVAIVMSGGTEGGLSPHLLVICREVARRGRGAASRDRRRPDARVHPEEIGRARAGRGDGRCRRAPRWRMPASTRRPTFISSRSSAAADQGAIEEARSAAPDRDRGHYCSMASRGASALGVALGLGEIEAAPRRRSAGTVTLSSVASTSAGVGLLPTRSSCWATPPAGRATW